MRMTDSNEKIPTTTKNSQDADISDISTRIFGFEVGKHVMDIEAKNEQEAMQKLVEIYWHFIDDVGEVKLLGAQDNVC